MLTPEGLRSRGRDYAAADLKNPLAAGVEVTLEVEEGLIHVWQMLPGVPEAQSAIDRIGVLIAQKC
jgi:acetyl esterase/lipase